MKRKNKNPEGKPKKGRKPSRSFQNRITPAAEKRKARNVQFEESS